LEESHHEKPVDCLTIGCGMLALAVFSPSPR
jgi:hypothetical protein